MTVSHSYSVLCPKGVRRFCRTLWAAYSAVAADVSLDNKVLASESASDRYSLSPTLAHELKMVLNIY